MADRYLHFSAQVNDDTANRFCMALAVAANQGVSRLNISINSSGGNVVAGIGMYNMLRAMPYPVVTHNIGNIDSITNAVFLGGTERYASPSSTFMFHGVAFPPSGETLDEKVLRAKLDTILADQKRISNIIASHTRLTAADGMRLFREQKTRPAAWALDKGLIHEIRDHIVPSGADFQFIA